MSGTIDQNQAAADVAETTPEGFFFSLQADDNGVTELKFRKDADKLFGVVLFGLEYINQTFDAPFPCVGDFCRYLGGVADQIEAAHNEYVKQEEGNGQASEAANDAGPEAPEAA
jgi:hypothetical protein